MTALTRLLILIFGAGLIFGPAGARERTIEVSERYTLAGDQLYGRDAAPAEATHELALTLVYFTGGDWPHATILGAVRATAEILQPCGVRLRRIEVVRVEAPQRYHYFNLPVSRELARTLALSRPTVYFVADTLQQPAFDAEAIGRSNSRTRPELADSVWITRAARDPGVALAHELVHVLADSGEHVDLPGNLMRAETAPENTQLTRAQCVHLRAAGAKNGLLRRE